MNAPFSRSLISDHNFWSCHKDDFLNQFWKLWGQIFPFGYLPFSAATSSSWVTLLNRLKGWNALNNQNTQLNIVTIQGFRMPKILPVSKKKTRLSVMEYYCRLLDYQSPFQAGNWFESYHDRYGSSDTWSHALVIAQGSVPQSSLK